MYITNIATRHVRVSFTFNLSNKTESITHAKNTTRMSPEHFHLYYLIVALPACCYPFPPFYLDSFFLSVIPLPSSLFSRSPDRRRISASLLAKDHGEHALARPTCFIARLVLHSVATDVETSSWTLKHRKRYMEWLIIDNNTMFNLRLYKREILTVFFKLNS